MSMKSINPLQAVVTAARTHVIRTLKLAEFNWARVGLVSMVRASVATVVCLVAVRPEPICVVLSHTVAVMLDMRVMYALK